MKHRTVATHCLDIPSVLAGLAQSQPDNAAILAPGREPLSFARLHAMQEYVHAVFSIWGVNRGHSVAVVLPKGPEMAAALAVLPVSATVVPLDPNLAAADYEKLYQRCAARALVLPGDDPHNARFAAQKAGLMQIGMMTDPGSPAGAFKLELLEDAAGACAPRNVGEEFAYIVGTSGTTSERKLIPYTHDRIVLFAQERKSWFRFESADLSLHLVPMYFAHGVKTSLMVPILSGASIVCPPAYEAGQFFSLLEQYRPTWFSAGFTILRDILRHADEYPDILANTRLRFIRSGAGRLEVDEITRLEDAFGAPLIVNLGTSETTAISCNPLPPQRRKIESVGLPTTNEVRIRDFDGRFVDTGIEGEIVVRGPLVFDGYFDDPEATENAFVDGWYRTGDIGKFDEDGFLYLTGRIKEIINCGGEKISPAEIDHVLELHPAVAEAAAFGWPHPTLGEIVVAAVVLKPGITADDVDLLLHMQAHLTNSKVPAKFFFVESLLRTGNGKLQRDRLLQAVT